MIAFAEYGARIQEHVEQAYHVSVVTRDIPAPLLGDLDGLEIHIDPAVWIPNSASFCWPICLATRLNGT